MNTKGVNFNRRKGVNFRPPLTALYIENELSDKRDELTHMFDR